jgi:dipeptidase
VQAARKTQGATYHFRRAHSDVVYTRFSGSRARQCATEARLKGAKGARLEDMFALLRSHAPAARYDPAHGSNADVCMHFGGGPIRVNQTTGSLVAHIHPDGPATFWLTGTSAPCLSLFKPFSFEAFLSEDAPTLAAALGPEPGARDDGGASLWWQGERLHRAVVRDYRGRAAAFQTDLAQLQGDFIAQTARLEQRGGLEAVHAAAMVAEARRAVDEWAVRVKAIQARPQPLSFYQRAWRHQSTAAQGPLP